MPLWPELDRCEQEVKDLRVEVNRLRNELAQRDAFIAEMAAKFARQSAALTQAAERRVEP